MVIKCLVEIFLKRSRRLIILFTISKAKSECGTVI